MELRRRPLVSRIRMVIEQLYLAIERQTEADLRQQPELAMLLVDLASNLMILRTIYGDLTGEDPWKAGHHRSLRMDEQPPQPQSSSSESSPEPNQS